MFKRTLLLLLTATATLSAMAQKINYPPTAKDNTVDTYFGEQVADPYRWLEDDTAAATKAWVEAENKVTFDYLKRIPFRDKLLQRMREVQDYERIGAPAFHSGKWYTGRNDGLQNQSVIYQSDTPDGPQRVFLDPNKLSSDGTVALSSLNFSKDGRYAAYVIARSGSDWNEIYVMDAQTLQPTGDHIVWAKFTDATWQGDGFYYSAYDAPEQGKEFSNVNENHKIYYHKIGTPQSDDVLVYHNPTQPRRFYVVEMNDDETIMFLHEAGFGSGSNVFVRDLRQPGSQFIQITDDPNFRYSFLGNVGDKMYFRTNNGAPRGRVMVADLKKPGFNDWTELIGETENTLQSVQIIDNRLFLTYQEDAVQHVYVHTLDGKLMHEVNLPNIGYVSFSGRQNRPECFFILTSFTQPVNVYSYDIDANRYTLFRAPKVNFKQDDFETRQVFYNSKDGTRVPMCLTYKKGLKLNGKNPVLLYGYGGFNISMPPNFAAARIPFLENGGIYAQVNLRGGSEYGEAWHQAGTKMQKQNVFDDFISAAEWLVANNYTNPEKIAIEGASNGGLLVGACLAQRPDLFKVALPAVGVMDMLRYHKFTIGWNWASDYGSSEDSPEMFRYLKAYSPLHALKPGTHYPATLVTTADHDDRVVPAHSFKFAATLQACNDGPNPTLIRIDTKAGHGGGKPIAKQLEEKADAYSFMMYNLGMKVK